MERGTASAKSQEEVDTPTLGGAVEICFSTRGKLSKVFCEKILCFYQSGTSDQQRIWRIRLWFHEEAELGNLMYLVEREGFRFQQRRVWNLNDTEKPGMSWHI